MRQPLGLLSDARQLQSDKDWDTEELKDGVSFYTKAK
jgi:hypothetical protein